MPFPSSRLLSRLGLSCSVLLLCAACASTQGGGSSEKNSGETKMWWEPEKAAAPAASAAKAQPSKAQQELASGVASYEDGAYKQATRQLQNALALGLDSAAEQATAHKYLAFMYCVGKRQSQCRDEFGKALAADSSFDLTPAEIGHPIWGPVFRKLKAAQKSAK